MAEPETSREEPFVVEEGAGRLYLWRCCGKMVVQPLRNFGHQETGFNPVKYTAAESETLCFRRCKRTVNAPLCDGTHTTH